MRKALFSLAAAVIAFGVPALSLSAASAASSPTLGCNVQPSENDNFNSVCSTSDAADTYGVTFLVQGAAGTSSFAWTVPSGITVADGCTSTSDLCVIDVRAVAEDQRPTVSVVVTQNGSSVSLSARALINAVCGNVSC